MEKLFAVKNIPFAEMTKKDLDYWEDCAKNSHLSHKFSVVITMFITEYTLREVANKIGEVNEYTPAPLIWNKTVGFMSTSWVNEYVKEKQRHYKFGTGIYKYADNFLLFDDLEEWVHGRRKKECVRSAFDLILEIKKGDEESCPKMPKLAISGSKRMKSRLNNAESV